MIRTVFTALMLIVFAGLLQAQETAEPSAVAPKVGPRPALAPNTDSRRFAFTLDELDHGRKLNTRTLEVLCREHEYSVLKAGSRVPIAQGAISGNGQPSTNFQYIDVGLNVRAYYVLRADGKLDVRTEFDMSNVAPPDQSAPHTGEYLPPLIRQTRSEVSAAVAGNTPTVLDNIEDLSSGHTYQLTLTVKEH